MIQTKSLLRSLPAPIPENHLERLLKTDAFIFAPGNCQLDFWSVATKNGKLQERFRQDNPGYMMRLGSWNNGDSTLPFSITVSWNHVVDDDGFPQYVGFWDYDGWVADLDHAKAFLHQFAPERHLPWVEDRLPKGNINRSDMNQMMNDTVYSVEACCLERQKLLEWGMTHKAVDTWDRIQETVVNIGRMGEEDVVLGLVWIKINGKLVMFHEPIGKLFNLELRNQWMKKNFDKRTKDDRPAECNGLNFGHCLSSIKEAV